MTVNPRPIRIYAVTSLGKNKRRRLVSVLNATSLRKALEQFAKNHNVKDPVFVGNTMSGAIGNARILRKYEAQEAK